jgi:hypothetical protein
MFVAMIDSGNVWDPLSEAYFVLTTFLELALLMSLSGCHYTDILFIPFICDFSDNNQNKRRNLSNNESQVYYIIYVLNA